jgi:hypothetical protein
MYIQFQALFSAATCRSAAVTAQKARRGTFCLEMCGDVVLVSQLPE